MAYLTRMIIAIACMAITLNSDEPPGEEQMIEEPTGKQEENEEFSPWFTGSIIAPRSTAVPLGTIELNNYFYCTIYTGSFDSQWKEEESDHFFSLSPQLYYYFGLTPWLDLQITPTFYYQFTKGEQSLLFGDLTTALDFQLYENDELWLPSVKFSISETFPTGKYQEFNPTKLETDFGGYGTFGTAFTLLLYKIYHLWDQHSMSVSFGNIYTINTKTQVKGMNAYGGGYGTDGTVKVGNSFQSVLSFEFSLNQNWNLALDTLWVHADSSPFTGNPGIDEFEEEAAVGIGSTESLSFCPAIEYGFRENLGLIAGCWFTALGRNTDLFQAASFNLYYSF